MPKRQQQQQQHRFCPKKRDTDSYGGIKIQFAGKPNEYGYPQIQSLTKIPEQLESAFRQNQTKSSSEEDKLKSVLLWPTFWKDIQSVSYNNSPTNVRLTFGFLASMIGTIIAFHIEYMIIAILCLVLTVGCFILIFQNSINSDEGDNEEDSYVLHINQLLEIKYNEPYLLPKGWIARCHVERGVSSIDQRPGTYYIIHFIPYRKESKIKWNT